MWWAMTWKPSPWDFMEEVVSTASKRDQRKKGIDTGPEFRISEVILGYSKS